MTFLHREACSSILPLCTLDWCIFMTSDTVHYFSNAQNRTQNVIVHENLGSIYLQILWSQNNQSLFWYKIDFFEIDLPIQRKIWQEPLCVWWYDARIIHILVQLTFESFKKISFQKYYICINPSVVYFIKSPELAVRRLHIPLIQSVLHPSAI